MTPRRCPRDVESQRAGTRGRGVACAAVSGWVRLPRVRPTDASGSPPPPRPTRAPTALSPTRHALCSSPRVGTVSGVRPAGTCVLYTDAAPDTPALPSDTRAGPCAPSGLKHRLRGPRSSSPRGRGGSRRLCAGDVAGLPPASWSLQRRPSPALPAVPQAFPPLSQPWTQLPWRLEGTLPPLLPPLHAPRRRSALPPLRGRQAATGQPMSSWLLPADPPLALEETVPQRLLPSAAARGSRRPVRGTVTPSILSLQTPPRVEPPAQHRGPRGDGEPTRPRTGCSQTARERQHHADRDSDDSQDGEKGDRCSFYLEDGPRLYVYVLKLLPVTEALGGSALRQLNHVPPLPMSGLSRPARPPPCSPRRSGLRRKAAALGATGPGGVLSGGQGTSGRAGVPLPHRSSGTAASAGPTTPCTAPGTGGKAEGQKARVRHSPGRSTCPPAPALPASAAALGRAAARGILRAGRDGHPSESVMTQHNTHLCPRDCKSLEGTRDTALALGQTIGRNRPDESLCTG